MDDPKMEMDDPKNAGGGGGGGFLNFQFFFNTKNAKNTQNLKMTITQSFFDL